MTRRVVPVMAIAAATLACGVVAAYATPGSGPAPSGAVSPKPVSWTPRIATSGTDGSVEQIRQLTPCVTSSGTTMYAAGRFTSVAQGSMTYQRSNVMSFDAGTGAMTAFAPNVNGQVNTIALSPDCGTAYLGGTFTSINGTTVKNIAAVNVNTGVVLTTFGSSAAQVNNIQPVNGHLFVGSYGSVNGSVAADSYVTSVSPTTGKDDHYLQLNISGHYDFPGAYSNATRGYNFQVSHHGTKVLVEGDFKLVGGQPRQQVFMLDLGVTATVDGWTSDEFNTNCNPNETFYLQDAAWSADDSSVYVATTGYKPYGTDPGNLVPRTGLCDAAAAFPAQNTTVVHNWIEYTGCDSYYSIAADQYSVYVGGHERWANNPHQCDNNTDGSAVTDAGMAGLNPSTGSAYTTVPGGLTGYYTRGRGLGADDMIIIPTGKPGSGLWIASDNAQNTSTCGGVKNLTGLCHLPY